MTKLHLYKVSQKSADFFPKIRKSKGIQDVPLGKWLRFSKKNYFNLLKRILSYKNHSPGDINKNNFSDDI